MEIKWGQIVLFIVLIILAYIGGIITEAYNRSEKNVVECYDCTMVFCEYGNFTRSSGCHIDEDTAWDVYRNWTKDNSCDRVRMIFDFTEEQLCYKDGILIE